MSDPFKGEVFAVIRRYDLFDEQGTWTDTDLEERIYFDLNSYGIDATATPIQSWWHALARKPDGPYHATYLKEQERQQAHKSSTLKIEEVKVGTKAHVTAEARRLMEEARQKAPSLPPPKASATATPKSRVHRWKGVPADIIHAFSRLKMHKSTAE